MKAASLKNIALVIMLSLATLWLNSANAAHIHLDDHEHQGELCRLHSSATTLETNIPKLVFVATRTEIVIDLVKKPQLIPVAPCNSRAPPYL